MKYTVRASVPADAFNIDLRNSDRIEGASWVPGVAVHKVLAASMSQCSSVTAVSEAGDIICIFGASKAEHYVAPWLMCSVHMVKFQKQLLRCARQVIDGFIQHSPGKLLGNHVHRDNQQAKRFLQSLGFHIMPTPGTGEFQFFFHPKSCA